MHDLETMMSVNLEVESEDHGAAAVPAKTLLDTLKTFPEQHWQEWGWRRLF